MESSAAWGYAFKKYGSKDKAKEFVGKLYKQVPVLDTGARGATVSFVERGQGDVLLAWENGKLRLAAFGCPYACVGIPSSERCSANSP